MNLSLLFKINAVVIGINGLSALFFPNFWFDATGLTAGPLAYAAAHGLGCAVIGTALLSWRIPDVAGDGMYPLGIIVGITHSLFVLLSLYEWQIAQVLTGFPVYSNLVISIVLAALFFYSSRKA